MTSQGQSDDWSNVWQRIDKPFQDEEEEISSTIYSDRKMTIYSDRKMTHLRSCVCVWKSERKRFLVWQKIFWREQTFIYFRSLNAPKFFWQEFCSLRDANLTDKSGRKKESVCLCVWERGEIVCVCVCEREEKWCVIVWERWNWEQ